MYGVLSSEFLKLKKSKMLLLAAVASVLPSFVKYIQLSTDKANTNMTWEYFLASKQEFTVMGMLITLILVASFVFNMEYQYKTAAYILTSRVSRVSIYFSKLLAILAIIFILFVLSGFSQLLLGYFAIKTAVASALMIKFLKVTALYILTYFLLTTVIVMLGVFIKRFVLTSVIIFGYLMMVFPFHLKNNLYINPFMTPSAIAAKIYGTGNYILANGYYSDVTVNSAAAVIFLIVLALVSLISGLFFYRSSDAMI